MRGRKRFFENVPITRTPLYIVYHGIRSRCNNPKSTGYKYYGGRGISICDEWQNSYLTFHAWAIQNGYKHGLTIERKDNNGNYCPENCVWISQSEQANNKRWGKFITHNGETHNITKWSKILNISRYEVKKKFNLFT